MSECRVCGGAVREFVDFGRQPISDAFPAAGAESEEYFFRLAAGQCEDCTMVQLMEEVPRDLMFRQDYPYYSSGSAVMRKHFEQTARRFLETELTGPDPFIVEIGCNDGVMLKTIKAAGVRHLGVEPSGGVAGVAAAAGVRVMVEFFEEETAKRIRETDGPANVIFAANTLCHIPYIGSVLRGVRELLADDGVFVFEDPYLGDIVAKTSFDQIYDEHFYFFTARSVQSMAARFGLELVDVQRLAVHGGEVRYTLTRPGARTPSPAVAELIAAEDAQKLTERATLEGFAANVQRIRDDLVALLTRLRDEGKTVVGYGATAKSATVTNYCSLGTGLISYVCDTTPAKQGRLTPGTHIPVRPVEAFQSCYPDYAVLFAWNHADEIMAKERGFREAGGKWITYVPEVRIS
ncbi:MULTISPECIES: class I SAM-dependent methyltransferase [Thermomonospora]|uniref:C-methyltransferase n=1 Tax=Thermomonospora curvata (strain ATCC 19995 / DSM 43183 / JCM 3096 / KCTC 9072 / NBRC 15933 / NCIMB 10081 / Henssen B9) TaxID=471852 RepID=D1A610_THECD|nr:MULTISPECIES: class I SAM-dependent methyltransferase [Thermomonospora]ACY98305.1 C-methyltransferase [Thermomonospora curvata DSM 43183]PKK13472.1 MAG: class I SAM-dependent methyltransferase [Thermomonospora sp. CIF 1]